MRLGYKAHESLQCPAWDRNRMAGRFLGFKVWDRRGYNSYKGRYTALMVVLEPKGGLLHDRGEITRFRWLKASGQEKRSR